MDELKTIDSITEEILKSFLSQETPPASISPISGVGSVPGTPSYTNVTSGAPAMPSVPDLTKYLDEIRGENQNRLLANDPYKQDLYGTYKTIADMTANQTQVNKDIKDYIAEQYGNYGKINSQANEAVLGALTGRNTQLNTLSNAFANTDRTINPAILAAADVALKPQQQAALDLAATRDVLMQTPTEMVKTGAEIYNDQIKAQQVKAEAAKELITMNNNDFSILSEIIGKYPALKQTEFGMGLQARNQTIGENQAQNTIASQEFADQTARREQMIQDNLYANQVKQQDYENKLTAQQNKATGLQNVITIKQEAQKLKDALPFSQQYVFSSFTNDENILVGNDGGRIITKDTIKPFEESLQYWDKFLPKGLEPTELKNKLGVAKALLEAKEYYQMNDEEKAKIKDFLSTSKSFLTGVGLGSMYEKINPYVNQDYLNKMKLFGTQAKGLSAEEIMKASDPLNKQITNAEKQKVEFEKRSGVMAQGQFDAEVAKFTNQSKEYFDALSRAEKMVEEDIKATAKDPSKTDKSTAYKDSDGTWSKEGRDLIGKEASRYADEMLQGKSLPYLNLAVPTTEIQSNLLVGKLIEFIANNPDVAIKRMGIPPETFGNFKTGVFGVPINPLEERPTPEEVNNKVKEYLKEKLNEDVNRGVTYIPIDLTNLNKTNEMGELLAIKNLFDTLTPLYKTQIDITS